MKNSIKKKPKHFFILGAAKCGTSSLFYYLDQHPEIYIADKKEPFFFEKEFDKGYEYYWKTYFSNWKGEKLVGDARHRNLYLPYIPVRIAKIFPNTKLIVIVRNPIDRAYSHYNHRKVRRIEKGSFEDAIAKDLKRIEKYDFINSKDKIAEYSKNLKPDGSSLHSTIIDSGYYAEQIERYLKYFKRNQLHIVFLEDLKFNNKDTYFNILKFLDDKLSLYTPDFSIKNKRTPRLYNFFDRYLYSPLKINKIIPKILKLQFYKFSDFFENKMNKKNLKMNKKNLKMKVETRAMLISHYKEHNKKLEKLTERDLSHWDK